MFDFFAYLFGYVLNAIYGIVNNYGIAIIIFTIILKLIMLPISIKQQKTMKKTAKIQVKVKELQDKYSNDPVRLNQEMMDVYKQENMSPFSGCLSSILQFIIILSIFFLVSKPLTFMKQIDEEVITGYTKELSEQGVDVRYPEIAIIKEKSAEDESVRLNMDFLGLDLSDVPSQNYNDPKVFIIPVLYVFTSIISTRLINNFTKNSKDENKEKEDKKEEKALEKTEKEQTEADAMEEMNKQMKFMMPIMTVSIALIAPLGLALYWFVSNLLMIVERLIINRVIRSEEE